MSIFCKKNSMSQIAVPVKILCLLFSLMPLSALSEPEQSEILPVQKTAETPLESPQIKANTKSARDSAVVTLQSTITGNREQPKVLYIVPWQAPDGPESLRRGFQSSLDELFQPVERAEFLRQLKNRDVPLTSTGTQKNN